MKCMEMCKNTDETRVEDMVRQIKRSFRLFMNGDASRSMREKGLEYKLNWGISLVQLKQMSKDYGKDLELANRLFGEEVRECKILATLVLPVELMDRALAEDWADKIKTGEMAEICVMNVFCKLSFAVDMANDWICSADSLHRVCAYNLLGRLSSGGKQLPDAVANQLCMSAKTDLAGADTTVRHAAYNCLTRCADNEGRCGEMCRAVLKSLNLDIF